MKKNLIITFLIFAFLSPSIIAIDLLSKCENLARRAEQQECPQYVILKEIFKSESVDPYHNAVELSKIRLNYLLTAKKYLLSTAILPEEKAGYCLARHAVLQEPYDKANLKKENGFNLKPVMTQLKLNPWDVADSWGLSNLQDITPEEIIVSHFLVICDSAILQWRYFHQSLLNIRNADFELIGVKELMKEALLMSHYADLEYAKAQTRHNFDNIFFSRSLVDTLTFYLFCCDALSHEDREIALLFIYKPLHLLPPPDDNDVFTRKSTNEARQLRKVIKEIVIPGTGLMLPAGLRNRLNDMVTNGFYAEVEEAELGGWLAKSLLNDRVTTQITWTFQALKNEFKPSFEDERSAAPVTVELDLESTASTELLEEDEEDTPLKSQAMSAIELDLKDGYLTEAQQKSHIYRLSHKLPNQPGKKNLALRYFLTPENPSYSSYKLNAQRLEENQELKHRIERVIAVDLQEIAEREKAKQKRHLAKQKEKEEQEIRRKLVQASFIPILPPKKGQKKKDKSPSKRSNNDTHLLPPPLKNGFHLPKSTRTENGKQAPLLNPITIVFKEEFIPPIEELMLYKKIWSVKRMQEDLSWRKMISEFLSFGWSVRDAGGSFCLLQPPEWLRYVGVFGMDVMPLQRTSFMIQYPCDATISPMPSEAIDFLRLAFHRDLGMSGTIVDCLVSQVSSLYAHQRNDNKITE